jgi:hypothetical protein
MRKFLGVCFAVVPLHTAITTQKRSKSDVVSCRRR